MVIDFVAREVRGTYLDNAAQQEKVPTGEKASKCPFMSSLDRFRRN